MSSEEQQFLNDLDKRLWNAADRLRSNVNPSDYMHVVLGLVFLKYVSDAFNERRAELQAAFTNPEHDGLPAVRAGPRGVPGGPPGVPPRPPPGADRSATRDRHGAPHADPV